MGTIRESFCYISKIIITLLIDSPLSMAGKHLRFDDAPRIRSPCLRSSGQGASVTIDVLRKVVTTSTHQRMSINVRIKATKERRKIDVLYQRAIYQTTIYRQFCKLSKIYLFNLFTYIIYIIMQYKSFAYFRRPKATSLKSRNRRVETFIRYPSVVSSIFGRSGVALWANLRRMNRGRGLKRDALFSAATKLYSRVP